MNEVFVIPIFRVTGSYRTEEPSVVSAETCSTDLIHHVTQFVNSGLISVNCLTPQQLTQRSDPTNL